MSELADSHCRRSSDYPSRCAVCPGCWALLTTLHCVEPQVDPHLTRFIAELKLRDASAGEPMEVAAPEGEAPPLAHMPSEPTPPATELDAKVHPPFCSLAGRSWPARDTGAVGVAAL